MENKYVVFENPGVIDIRLVRTFGVSAKENENPIGYFGTGLKYAIAILLRENHEVEMVAGGSRYVFEKKTVQVRNKQVEMITMNGEELPFTTHLGVNWKIWQAFREIYCNCKDERGQVYTLLPGYEQSVRLHEDKTYFLVRGQEFMDCYHMRDSILLNLPGKMLLYDGPVQIYNRPSQQIFYRGVRVMETDKQTMFTYNVVHHINLTEDRTPVSPHAVIENIALNCAKLNDKATIRKIITAPSEYIESIFSYNLLQFYENQQSEEFIEVLAEEFNNNNDNLNNGVRNFYRDYMNKRATKHYEVATMSSVERQQMERALMVCKAYLPDFKYEIKVVGTLGQRTMALADRSTNTIVVSKTVFKLGTKYLVSTLLEEYTHLKHGLDDCTREMQTHLFDTIATLIEEHVIREPI